MQISLYYQQGSSDKEYHVQLAPQGAGWVVNFQYGRRGGALNSGTKTQQPVSEAEARKIYARLVTEKKAKGYTEGAAGTPYTGTNDKQASGVVPQLLNPVEEDQAGRYLTDDTWCAQEKYDGRNRLLRITLTLPADRNAGTGLKKVEGINKLGHIVGIPQYLVEAGVKFGPGLLAGEDLGDRLCVFDLLDYHGADLRALPYRARYTALIHALALLPADVQHVLPLAPTAWTSVQKHNLWRTLKQQRAEGLVFKQVDAPYTPGRPNSGGDQLKMKFYATLSAIVARINARRSVGLHLVNAGGEQRVEIGNVTIPPNQSIPQPGSVVEVRYLYAYPDGCLFQPVYLGPRDDVRAKECGLAQLKFKRDEQE
jgi:bifunctional non-homologous end joining protein LigD